MLKFFVVIKLFYEYMPILGVDAYLIFNYVEGTFVSAPDLSIP